jgi:hypothetical protein
VLGAGIDNTTILDGLTISGGNADGTSANFVLNGREFLRNSGGGIYNGLASYSSSPVLINVTISGNKASDSGGGAHSYYYYSAPVFVNVLISGNTANQGGGMANVSYSSPKLINVTIAGNYANSSGGGIFSEHSDYSIQNGVIWGNNSGSYSAIYTSLGTVTIANSIVEGSGGTSSWNEAALAEPPGPFGGTATDGGGNLDEDPLFTTLVQAASGSPKIGGDYRLSDSSPAIDTGDSTEYDSAFASLSIVNTDLAGSTRKQGAAIDMGAYEKQ